VGDTYALETGGDHIVKSGYLDGGLVPGTFVGDGVEGVTQVQGRFGDCEEVGGGDAFEFVCAFAAAGRGVPSEGLEEASARDGLYCTRGRTLNTICQG
jgi:hypothetical protein